MDNSENVLSVILEKLFLLCMLVFFYFGYLHIKYKDNQPVTVFEEQCREVHAKKKFYKSYCTCLAHGIIKYDLSDLKAPMVTAILLNKDDKKSKKMAFDILERQILEKNQCSFEVSYIEYMKESLIK